MLASAILLALSGADVFAEAPQMTGSQNGMSQSSMMDVKSGKEAGKTGGDFRPDGKSGTIHGSEEIPPDRRRGRCLALSFGGR